MSQHKLHEELNLGFRNCKKLYFNIIYIVGELMLDKFDDPLNIREDELYSDLSQQEFEYTTFQPTIIDMTAKANKKRRIKNRRINDVYALVLHQMGCCYNRSSINRYLGVNSHFVILPDGRILQLHPESALLYASHGFNKGSVAVEFAGNFPSTRGRWWKGHKYGRNQVTSQQIESGRFLIKYLLNKINLTHILAHRQSARSRANDPGPDLWYYVGQWAINNLGLNDGGSKFSVGTGLSIPEAWRKWGKSKTKNPYSGENLELADISLQNQEKNRRCPKCMSILHSSNFIDGFSLEDEFKKEQNHNYEFSTAKGCITPGNPYVLHCFPSFKSGLTIEHKDHLDRIVNKVVESFFDGKPIKQLHIVGHAATWRNITINQYGKRGFQRANNARAYLNERLREAGLFKKVIITTETHGNAFPIQDNMTHSSSKKAQRNRAINRRVEIHLISQKDPEIQKPAKPRELNTVEIKVLVWLIIGETPKGVDLRMLFEEFNKYIDIEKILEVRDGLMGFAVAMEIYLNGVFAELNSKPDKAFGKMVGSAYALVDHSRRQTSIRTISSRIKKAPVSSKKDFRSGVIDGYREMIIFISTLSADSDLSDQYARLAVTPAPRALSAIYNALFQVAKPKFSTQKTRIAFALKEKCAFDYPKVRVRRCD